MEILFPDTISSRKDDIKYKQTVQDDMRDEVFHGGLYLTGRLTGCWKVK